MSRLVFTSDFLSSLRENLLKHKQETCAILYGRAVEVSGKLARIVVRESVHPQPEAYKSRSSARVQLKPEFVAEAVQRARRNSESVVFVHTYPFAFNKLSEINDALDLQLVHIM